MPLTVRVLAPIPDLLGLLFDFVLGISRERQPVSLSHGVLRLAHLYAPTLPGIAKALHEVWPVDAPAPVEPAAPTARKQLVELTGKFQQGALLEVRGWYRPTDGSTTAAATVLALELLRFGDATEVHAVPGKASLAPDLTASLWRDFCVAIGHRWPTVPIPEWAEESASKDSASASIEPPERVTDSDELKRGVPPPVYQKTHENHRQIWEAIAPVASQPGHGLTFEGLKAEIYKNKPGVKLPSRRKLDRVIAEGQAGLLNGPVELRGE